MKTLPENPIQQSTEKPISIQEKPTQRKNTRKLKGKKVAPDRKRGICKVADELFDEMIERKR